MKAVPLLPVEEEILAAAEQLERAARDFAAAYHRMTRGLVTAQRAAAAAEWTGHRGATVAQVAGQVHEEVLGVLAGAGLAELLGQFRPGAALPPDPDFSARWRRRLEHGQLRAAVPTSRGTDR